MKTKILSILGLMVIGLMMNQACLADQPKMNGKLKVTTLAPEDACYTGKPYSKELGAYVFSARDYDPQTSRWTAPDPSGFPDGPNNRIYAPVPTIEIDPTGLVTLAVTDDGNGSPANHANNTYTWTWSISHNGGVVLSGGATQTATAQYVNNHIASFGAITVPNASVGTAYTFEFYAPGTVTIHDTLQQFYINATETHLTEHWGTWVDTGWSLTALAFDSVGVQDYTGLNNQPNNVVNNGIKLLSNTNFGGGIDSFLKGKLRAAGFSTASSDPDKFYVGGGTGVYNE